MTEADSFYTAKSDSVKSASFLIWGDSGTGNSNQYKIASLMEKENVDFCLHVGDVSQYCQGWDAWAGDVNVQNYLVPVFEDNQVDMVFNGHTHDYERGQLNGVYYVITGGGGGAMDTWGREYDHIDVTIFKFHYTRVDINGEQLYLQAYDIDEKQIESLIINKTATGLEIVRNDLPTAYRLYQNYPNPFNPITKINFKLAKDDFVDISIYNPLGQRISTILREKRTMGTHSVVFDASSLPSGVYFYKINTSEFSDIKKMTFVR